MKIDLVMAALLFFVAYIPSCWVIYRSGDLKSTPVNAITAGIFIGAALFHMLPEAMIQIHQLTSNDFLWTIIICLLTMQSMNLWSRLLKTPHQLAISASLSSIFIVIMLGVHSLCEGMTLGFTTALNAFLAVFIAIIFHKSAASFALTSHLLRHQYSRISTHSIMLIFSLLSPLGIIIGATSITIFSTRVDAWLAGVFLSIAAGTFVYIALYEYIIPLMHGPVVNRKSYLLFCALGIILMGLLALIV